ncbi:hypothetical protein [Streptomyces sp. 7N604]|uniref:hypothetical protein n=1 Tax=Streptomyces sp. 7N604 TaxID=3457415 RepID=UPI003FCEFD28
MSSQQERDALGELLFREFAAYAVALTEHGEQWAQVWPRKDEEEWPPGSELDWLHGRFVLAREAAAVVGVRLSDKEITRQHQERLEYLRAFPNGMPSLTG